MFWVILLICVFLLLCTLFFFSEDNEKSGSWTEFYNLGSLHGFTTRQIHCIKEAVVQSALKEPCSIFYNIQHLTLCIAGLKKLQQKAEPEKKELYEELFSKLFALRHTLDMSSAEQDSGTLTTTKNLPHEQKVLMEFPDTKIEGVVIQQNEDAFEVLIPHKEVPYFSKDIIGDMIEFICKTEGKKTYRFLCVLRKINADGRVRFAHSHEIERIQNRLSPRIPIDFPCRFVMPDEETEEPRSYEGTLIDISEGGVSAEPEEYIETAPREFTVRFSLNQTELSLKVQACHISEGKEDRRQRFHLKFTDISPQDINLLRFYIYDIDVEKSSSSLPEDKDSEPPDGSSPEAFESLDSPILSMGSEIHPEDENK